MAETDRTHEEATIEIFRRDPDLAAEYLNSMLLFVFTDFHFYNCSYIR